MPSATHSAYVLFYLPTDFFHDFLPQAFKGHALADPFDCPGQADLTANVDFAYLTEALKGTGTPLSSSLKKNDLTNAH
jgi:SAM-dependent MidA family methyltransferase